MIMTTEIIVKAMLIVWNQCIADWEKDGRYNHVAFVVASGSKISSGYDDVTIAQHTSNCCARVTSSVTGWGNTFAV